MKAKERFARTASGFGSDGSIDGPSRDRDTPVWPESDRPAAAAGGAAEIEFVRPQTVGEEELQLQLAIAMSKEEAEQEDQKRRSDDVRLQLALSQSEQDFKKTSDKKPESHLVDLLDISFGASGISSPPHNSDPWGLPSVPPQPQPRSNDIWAAKPADPWLPPPPSSLNSHTASAFPMSDVAAARTISPSANSSSSIEGWLQNVPPPMAGAVPVLPAKPTNNDMDGAWSMKPVNVDPWNGKQHTQQVPDPWNSKSLDKAEPLDPWAPIMKNQSSGVS